jgi:chromosome segregation ATPase
MLAAATLLALVAGVGGIVMWRATSGSPAIEADHVAATRQLQARTVQASERLVEKTKGLEATQQESIDQLQMVQDQLQSVRELLAAQQADTKRLSEQVGTLTFAIEGLRQSFASAQTSETSAPSTRNRAVRTRAHASRGAQRHQRSRS